jgi:penicillin-binding protein 1C
MKPFLYLLALKQWYRIHDLLVDISDTYPSFQAGLTSISENYTLREYGLVRLSQALGNSLNNATVRLARMIGLSDVYAWYQDYGLVGDFPAEYYGYALVLGNPDITMIDLIRAYLRLVPSPDHTDYAEKFLLYHILSDPDNRDISFGVHSLLSTSIPQAVKTGTSSNFRDNTLMSYSPDMVIGIWVGNNDNSPMVGVTGITGAGVLWHETVEEMIRRGFIHERDLPIPSGIEKKMYCLDIPCYRREITYDKQGSLYESRISDGHYDRRDIPGLSSAEHERLHDLGFIVR